jgi:hypothetical protein
MVLQHVDRPLGAGLRLRIERESGPEPVVEDHVDRVLLRVVDHHAVRLDPLVGHQRLDDRLRPLPLVLEMRRVDVDQLIVLQREVDVVAERRELVASVAVRADLADPEHVGRVQVARDPPQHLLRQLPVLALLRVQAEPTEMRQFEFGRPLGLVVGQL